MADPIDVRTLTADELSAWIDLAEARTPEAKAMKDPANAPGQLPDTIPTDAQGRSRIPLGVRSIGVPPPAPNVYPEYTDPKDSFYNGATQTNLNAASRMSAPGGTAAMLAKLATPPDELRPNPNDDAATARKKSFALQKWVADNASRRQWLESASASTFFGGGPVVQLLNAATTKTPVDLLTLGALHGGGKALDALQFANRTGNTATGAVKGIAQYEAGSRLHAFLNGDKQPENDPRKRNPLDLLFEGGAGALGGLAGYKAAPVPVDKNAVAQQLFESHQQQIADTNNKIAAVGTAKVTAKAAELAAKRRLEDATRDLTRHETEVRAPAEGRAAQAHDTEAAALRVEQQTRQDRVAEAERAYAAAVKELNTYQSQPQGARTSVQVQEGAAPKINAVNTAAATLAEERKGLNASRLASLAHAGNPKAPTTALPLEQQRQKLLYGVDAATNDHRGTQDVVQGHEQQLAKLGETKTNLENKKVPEPKPTATDVAKKWFKGGALPLASMIPAVSQAVAYHHVPDMSRMIAATVGPSLAAMAHTEWGSKLLKFLYNNMASKGPQAIPALVNQGSRLPRDNQ